MIQNKTTTLYKKVNNKYIAVAENDPQLHYALPLGFWLLHVRENGCSYKKELHPNFIEALAAFDIARDRMSEMMITTAAYQPDKPLTKKQIAAWGVLNDIRFISPSVHDILEAGRQELIKCMYVSEGPIQTKINKALQAMEDTDVQSTQRTATAVAADTPCCNTINTKRSKPVQARRARSADSKNARVSSTKRSARKQ